MTSKPYLLISSSYSASDGSGGIHSSLDSGGMSTPSGGSSTPSTNSLGSQATSQTSTETSSTPATSCANPQAATDNSSTPASGFTPSQTDSSDHISGINLSSAGLNGFNSNNYDNNPNGTNLNGLAGGLTPSLGITGGTPYTNGFLIDSSMIGRDLSTITPNYDSDMSHYFNDTSGIQKTEDTLAKIDSAWDTMTQWGNENLITPVQNAYNNYVVQPLYNLENNLSTTYDEGVTIVKSLIQDNKALNTIVNHPENIKWGEVGFGTVQLAGGVTESQLGKTVAVGGTLASEGLAAVPSIALGGYLITDGASNITGGWSRALNGLSGTTDGDTGNFVKNAYIAHGPSSDKVYSGVNIYNCTQLGVGAYSLGSGVANLAKNAVNVENSYLGYEAAAKEASTWSSISSTLKNINYSRWTTGGLAVKSVDINLGNIGTRMLNFGIDGTNTSQSIPSMPASNEKDKKN
jgi:hypothetical protein